MILEGIHQLAQYILIELLTHSMNIHAEDIRRDAKRQ